MRLSLIGRAQHPDRCSGQVNECQRSAVPQPGRRARRSERGHLLLDYFIGSSVFLIALASFLTATRARIKGLGTAERRVRAVAAASSALAEARASRVVPAGTHPIDGLIGGAITLTETPRDGLREVRVVARWKEPEGDEPSLELVTVLP